jgi:hypothetical protein
MDYVPGKMRSVAACEYKENLSPKGQDKAVDRLWMVVASPCLISNKGGCRFFVQVAHSLDLRRAW